MNRIEACNQRIIYHLSNLDKAKRDVIIDGLSFKQRSTLYDIFLKKTASSIDVKVQQSILTKIISIQDLTLSLSLKNEKTSFVAKIINFLSYCVSNVAYYFCLLTAVKTSQLINQILIKNKQLNQNECSDRNIDKSKLVNLLSTFRSNLENNEIKLKDLLLQHGFSCNIIDIDFDDKTSFKNLNLDGINFINCSFESTHFSNASLKETAFQLCEFTLSSFMNATIENVLFADVTMRSCSFTQANLNEVHFVRSSLIGSSFEDASLSFCSFFGVSMPGTHFLEALVSNTFIRSSDLKDTVFFDSISQFLIDGESSKSLVLTKPLTAFLAHPEVRGITTPKAYMKLDQKANTIPLRISLNVPKTNKEKIKEEVESILRHIQSIEGSKSAPIPQQLINTVKEDSLKYSESQTILKKAFIISKHVHSVFLPGGEDLPPALYGQEVDSKTSWGNDYRRSILELALIHECFHKGIPLMSLCRGFQITCAYFGAQLVQHIDGHSGFEHLDLLNPNQPTLIGSLFDKPLWVTSAHHQGIKHVGFEKVDTLEPLVSYKGIVKAAEPKAGASSPMILLQFHPEWFNADTADSIMGEIVDGFTTLLIDSSNEIVWNIFSDSAEKLKNQRQLNKELQLMFKQ
jgi:gamma-glutamyl-gamma-aminobutyrate hydrolase PuuD/uncharacterized protein YjbI with pentapeptide repeats